jgi:cytoskeletal protein CcmA (bactofilin family)
VPRFDNDMSGWYSKFAHNRGLIIMAWFDRNSGGKKLPEAEAEKPSMPAQPTPEAEAQPVVAGPKMKAEAVPTPSEPRLVGQLHKGSRITGQLAFEGSVRIDGSVEGEIRCLETLTIGEGAEVRARISSRVVIIRGKVEGNVTAKDKVELLAPGRLFGNVSTPRLIITEGVVFDGDCSMGAAKQGGVASSKSLNTEKVAVAQASKLQPDSSK